MTTLKKSPLRRALETHVASLPPDAPFGHLFTSAKIQEEIGTFDAADALAVAKQTSYRRVGSLALWATMIGALIGALALLPVSWPAGGWRIAMEISQTLALVLSFAAIIWISWTQPVDRWMRARGEAEVIRARLFSMLMQGNVPGADNKELLQQKLQCFVSAHLQNQLGYYRKRGAEHSRAAGTLTPFRVTGYLLTAIAVLIGLAAAVNVLAGLGLSIPLWVSSASQWLLVPEHGRWQLGLGAMASSILAFASARSLMEQNQRNASSYAATTEMVERIKANELSMAQSAAAKGETGPVVTFCENVQRVLSAEHLAWTLHGPSIPKG